MEALMIADSGVIAKAPQKTPVIPDELIYEIDEGQPIYYRGYRDVLSGKLKIEDIMGSSKRQALIVTELIIILRQLRKFFHLYSSELGIKIKKSRRAADIALYLRSRMSFEEAYEAYYADKMPDVIIEVDIKADLTDLPSSNDYVYRKTRQLLDNGAQKVIWIFTNSETILLAEAGKKKWELLPWTETIEVSHGYSFNVVQLLEDYENGNFE